MAPRRSGRRSGQQLRSASPPAPRGQTRQAGVVGEVRRQQFTVVVLGDWGRSPRMQYHALSLADQAHGHVHVVAYAGATPVGAVAGHKGITLWALPPPPDWLARCLPRPLALACKAVFQLLVLLVALLLRTPRCSHVLLQTPPCLPTFAACQLACWLRRSRLVTDWHNLGFTLLALSVRPGSALVRLAERYERSLGRRAHAHLCVTHALAAELQRPEWGVPSPVVLHDRPARQFRHITDAGVKHALFQRLRPILQASPSAQNAATAAGCDWLSGMSEREI
jgi:beta-1,4-mannosyltransferase